MKKHEKAAAAVAVAEDDARGCKAAANGKRGQSKAGKGGDAEMADAEGQTSEEEEEEELAGGSAAAAALLRDVRRLGEETLRVCQPELREGVLQGGGVPLDDLLRLLRLLQRLVAGGAGRLLEPGDKVSWLGWCWRWGTLWHGAVVLLERLWAAAAC